MGREREIKLRITSPDGFRRLVASLPVASTTLQRNHYFDTSDGALARAGALVRVREEEGRIALAVKRGVARGPARIDADEWEAPLDPSLWEAVRAGRAAIQEARFAPLDEAAAGLALRCVGSVENTRRVARGPSGARWELDETRFPWGEVHHELEVESDDPAGDLERARAHLARLGVAWDEEARTKSERLLAGLRARARGARER